MKSFKTMFKTEFKLSLRGMDMIIFSIAFPVIVAVILGVIYGQKPAFEGANYTFLEQSFGAIVSIGICAAGVMGLPLVLSDYRHKKILKRFKVTPVSPAKLIFVQVAINFIYSFISVPIVYIVTRLLFGINLNGSFLGFLGSFLLVLAALYSLGMMVAAVSPNMKTTNILCSVLYFPMIIFSGSTLPYEVMPSAMQKISDFMPLTQGIKLLKNTSLGLPAGNMLIPVIVLSALTVICTFVSIRFFKWE